MDCNMCLQVSCSVGGTCLADLVGPSSGGSPASSQPAAAPQPPTIQLITTPALPGALSIKQGSSYAACAPGQQPSKELPCELGATAAFGGANLTAAVLACPPPSCLGSTRCPQVGSLSQLHVLLPLQLALVCLERSLALASLLACQLRVCSCPPVPHGIIASRDASYACSLLHPHFHAGAVQQQGTGAV